MAQNTWLPASAHALRCASAAGLNRTLHEKLLQLLTQEVCGYDWVGAAQQSKGLSAHALWPLHLLGLGFDLGLAPVIPHRAPRHPQDVLDICTQQQWV